MKTAIALLPTVLLLAACDSGGDSPPAKDYGGTYRGEFTLKTDHHDFNGTGRTISGSSTVPVQLDVSQRGQTLNVEWLATPTDCGIECKTYEERLTFQCTIEHTGETLYTCDVKNSNVIFWTDWFRSYGGSGEIYCDDSEVALVTKDGLDKDAEQLFFIFVSGDDVHGSIGLESYYRAASCNEDAAISGVLPREPQ